MSVVRVGGKWVNPDTVIWIGVRHTAYHGQDEEWFATIRCEEGQGWDFKQPTEEDAERECDKLAAQVNGDDGMGEYQGSVHFEARRKDLR